MDHAEAVRMNAAEKYVLGELPANLRDAYEAHYFECAECALDVRAAATFVDAARDAFRGEARNIVLAPAALEESPRVRERAAAVREKGEKTGWFGLGWLKPAFAVPVFAAALVLLVAYQNAVQIPQLKMAPSQGAAAVYSSSVRLADTRGDNGSTVTIRSGEGFLLDFDFTPSASAASYTAELRDPSGRAVLQTQISGDQANQSLHLAVPPGLVRSAGRFALVMTSAASPSAPAAEVQRLTFAVAFHN